MHFSCRHVSFGEVPNLSSDSFVWFCRVFSTFPGWKNTSCKTIFSTWTEKCQQNIFRQHMIYRFLKIFHIDTRHGPAFKGIDMILFLQQSWNWKTSMICGRKSAGTPKAPILASTLPETYCNSKISLEKPMRWKMKFPSFWGKFGLNFKGALLLCMSVCQLSWLLFFVAEVCIVLAPWIPWIPQVFFGGIWIRLWYNSLLVEFGKGAGLIEGFLWIFSTRKVEELPPTRGFDLMIRVTRSPAFSLTFIGFWESPTNSLYSFATVKRWVGDIYIYIWIPNHDARFCEGSHIFSKKT